MNNSFYQKLLFVFIILTCFSNLFPITSKLHKPYDAGKGYRNILNNLEILDIEYQALEAERKEYIQRPPAWINTQRENNNEFSKSNIFISLGMNCGPGRQFEKKKLTEAFFPFDWCISDFESIYEALKNDFSNYLEKESLEVLHHPENAKHRVVHDHTYNIRYLHDFTLEGEPLNDYEQIRTKYFRRIDRLYRACSQRTKKVYFFRTSITKKQSLQLNQLIQQKFPQLNYTLVVINETKEFKKKWHQKNVRNFFLPGCKEAMMDKLKDVMAGWDKIFIDLAILKKPTPPAKKLTPLQKKRLQDSTLTS